MKAAVSISLKGLIILMSVAWGQIPQTISYQGVLTDDNGVPLDETVNLAFSLHSDLTGGVQLWTSETAYENFNVTDGIFQVNLGSIMPFNLDFSSPYWLKITINGTSLSPRIPFTASPYSLRAQSAASADTAGYVSSAVPAGSAGGDLTGTYPNPTISSGSVITTKLADQSVTTAKISPAGASSGQAMMFDGTNVVWLEPPVSAADITAVYVGAGLTGGGATGDVTLSVAFAGGGIIDSVAHSDHGHPGEDITSGTVAEVRIDAAITRDSELSAHDTDASAHHSPYTDAAAVTAMGLKGDGNPLHHDKTTSLAFSAITGVATDAQVPDNITIDVAKSAANADSLGSVIASAYATDSELTTHTIDAGAHHAKTISADINHTLLDGVTTSDHHVLYSHPNHSGDVTSAGDGATTVVTVDSGANITLKGGTAPTIEGNIQWNTSSDRILVGTGAGTQTFYSGAHATDTYVTNKDAHDHLGGDGATILHSSLGTVGTSDHHTKTTSATELTAGTLDNARFTAYSDLAAEGYLDNTASADLLTRSQADARFWLSGGNSVAATGILGTSTNYALDMRVNNVRALSLEPNTTSPNLIGGYFGNNVTSGVYGATIGGGGSSSQVNRVTDHGGTVGGGRNNQAGDNAGTTGDKTFATVSGGQTNTASDFFATVAGGLGNTASNNYATVGGGNANTASGEKATVGGGNTNTASNDWATISGGTSNTASGTYTTISGGNSNTASGAIATVGGGFSNIASGILSTVAGGQYNRASGGYAVVSGGGGASAIDSNSALGDYSTVAGGWRNKASGTESTVGGGFRNVASGEGSLIAGGFSNTA